MNNEDLIKILKFSHEIYKVKNLLRYKGMPGWENDNIERWDSVAEHSYRMALMSVMISPYLQEKINLEKVLKIILLSEFKSRTFCGYFISTYKKGRNRP